MKILTIMLFTFLVSCDGEEIDFIHEHCTELSYKVTDKKDPASKVIRQNTYDLCMEIYSEIEQ